MSINPNGNDRNLNNTNIERLAWFLVIFTILFGVSIFAYATYTTNRALSEASNAVATLQVEAREAQIKSVATNEAIRAQQTVEAAQDNFEQDAKIIPERIDELNQLLLDLSSEHTHALIAILVGLAERSEETSNFSRAIMLTNLHRLNEELSIEAKNRLASNIHIDQDWESFIIRVCAKAGGDLSEEEWQAFVPDEDYVQICPEKAPSRFDGEVKLQLPIQIETIESP